MDGASLLGVYLGGWGTHLKEVPAQDRRVSREKQVPENPQQARETPEREAQVLTTEKPAGVYRG